MREKRFGIRTVAAAFGIGSGFLSAYCRENNIPTARGLSVSTVLELARVMGKSGPANDDEVMELKAILRSAGLAE